MAYPRKGEVVNSGVFCINCEFVEQKEELDEGDSCRGCGCSLDSHVKVDVVVTD